jgi:pyridoxal phosphate enzyme (YggS family)
MSEIAEKVGGLMAEVRRLCEGRGGKFEDVTVVAATKYVDFSEMNQAVRAGILVVGENRIQDALRKFPNLLPVRKHFIGHLQTNKVKDAVKLFDCIESVDSYRLAEMINVESERALKPMPVLIEVNIAGDNNKYGVSPDELAHFLRKIALFKYLDVRGLMTVAPEEVVPREKDKAVTRQYFKKMNELFDLCKNDAFLKKEFKGFDTLSMGMTGDFDVAIEEGATEIRVGSYLFR